jgi:hypothetical protein
MPAEVKRIRSDAGEALLKALQPGGLLDNKLVGKVGWFANNIYTDPDSGRTTPVAEVAARNEFGDPSRNQPPRPMMRSTIEKRRTYWQKVAAKAVAQVLKGKTNDPKYVLELTGLVAASDIRDTIGQFQSPPLSPRTIDARIAKKKKGRILFASVTKPLIESGIMMKTLTNVVEDE